MFQGYLVHENYWIYKQQNVIVSLWLNTTIYKKRGLTLISAKDQGWAFMSSSTAKITSVSPS